MTSLPPNMDFCTTHIWMFFEHKMDVSIRHKQNVVVPPSHCKTWMFLLHTMVVVMRARRRSCRNNFWRGHVWYQKRDNRGTPGTLFLSFGKKKMNGDISFFHFSRNSLPQVHGFFRAQEKTSSLRKNTKNTRRAHSRPFQTEQAPKMSEKTSLGKRNREKSSLGERNRKEKLP